MSFLSILIGCCCFKVNKADLKKNKRTNKKQTKKQTSSDSFTADICVLEFEIPPEEENVRTEIKPKIS